MTLRPIQRGEKFTHPSFEGQKVVGFFHGPDTGPHEYLIDIIEKPWYTVAEDGQEYLWRETELA